MAKDRVLLRRKDGSGSGYVFSREDAAEFLKNNPDYAQEAEGSADAASDAAGVKAVRLTEDKAVPAPKAAR